MPLPKRNHVRIDEPLNLSSSLAACRKISEFNPIRFPREILLNFSHVCKIYPNGIIPLINLVSYYREQRVPFAIVEPNKPSALHAFCVNGWANAIDSKLPPPPAEHKRTTRLIQFHSPNDLDPLVNRILDLCLTSATLPKGVIETLEWALNETAGNILDHSERESGFVQMAFHPKYNHISFAVADCGIGIAGSMRRHFVESTNDTELIERAMKRGVTSKPGQNQGFGLAGISSIAGQSGGICNILSNQGHLKIRGGTINKIKLDWGFPGTFVEVQFDIDEAIDANYLIGYERKNYFDLKFESDDEPKYLVKVADHAENFGNRPAGRKIRNLVSNLLIQNQEFLIQVNLESIRSISSSWADEAFGKLLEEIGIEDFFSRIRFTGQNEFCNSVLEMAIQKRIDTMPQK